MPETNRPCSQHCISRITGWAGGRTRVWDQPGAYLGDFLARAGPDWHHSEWDFRKVIAAGPVKVHFDVQSTRYRSDNFRRWFVPLVVDRQRVQRTLGGNGAVELRGLICTIGFAVRGDERCW
jgi:hypothetical protein